MYFTYKQLVKLRRMIVKGKQVLEEKKPSRNNDMSITGIKEHSMDKSRDRSINLRNNKSYANVSRMDVSRISKGDLSKSRIDLTKVD